MKAEITRIGNLQRLCIPKRLQQQAWLGDEVELRVENHRLVISSERCPRQGWEEAFRAAGSSVEDKFLLETRSSEFERKEWKW